jgi:hypothetical protein
LLSQDYNSCERESALSYYYFLISQDGE